MCIFIGIFARDFEYQVVDVLISFQGTEFENLAETVLEDRFERLLNLVTWTSEDGDLPIAMALANIIQSEQMVGILRLRYFSMCLTSNMNPMRGSNIYVPSDLLLNSFGINFGKKNFDSFTILIKQIFYLLLRMNLPRFLSMSLTRRSC